MEDVRGVLFLRFTPRPNADDIHRRVLQCEQEVLSLENAVSASLSRMHRVQTLAQQREALFGLRGDTPQIVVDTYLEEGESLKRSHAMIDENMGVSQTILSALASQRRRLKGARRKLLDVANVLGLSSSLLRMSERRASGDRLLVWVCMVFVLLLIAVLWWFFV
jgi:golgi SNAP receptor complex member 2